MKVTGPRWMYYVCSGIQASRPVYCRRKKEWGPLVYKAFAVVLLHYAVKGHFGFSSKP